jgi:hypothetical protein
VLAVWSGPTKSWGAIATVAKTSRITAPMTPSRRPAKRRAKPRAFVTRSRQRSARRLVTTGAEGAVTI